MRIELDRVGPLQDDRTREAFISWYYAAEPVFKEVEWCAYCDMRDNVPMGYSANRQYGRTSNSTAFLKECVSRGWKMSGIVSLPSVN